MPYHWSTSTDTTRELRLWPHNSLPVRGFASVVLTISALAAIPLLTFLGSVLLWGILPFIMLAVGGTWIALQQNYRSRRILEVLTLKDDNAHLVRHNPRGPDQEWDCNRYWTTPELHVSDGPVPNYVTLRGAGREVEIGAFLSEDERKALYHDLVAELRR